jgi:hypothetical protein
MSDARATEVVIPFSKPKIVLLVAGGIALTGMCVWLYFAPATTILSAHRYSVDFVRAISVIGAPLMAMGTVAAAIKLFQHRPGLILDGAGFTYAPGFFSSPKRIAWADVQRMRAVKIRRSRYLMIDLQSAGRSNLLQRAMKGSWQAQGNQIAVSSSALAISFDDLSRLFGEFMERATAARGASAQIRPDGRVEPHF